MKSFRTIVGEAVEAAAQGGFVGPSYVERVAAELKGRLEAEGYAVHDIRKCVRPKGPVPDEIGRVMTEEELDLIGRPWVVP